MHGFARAWMLVALLIVANSAQAVDAKKFNLKIVDEAGKPVPKFEAMIYSGAGLHWVAGVNGTVALSAEQLPPVVRVIVRSDGYASASRLFAAGALRDELLKGEASIALSRGEEVKLQFHLPAEMSWPKGALPEVYFEAWKEVMQSARSAEGRQWYATRNGNKPLDLNMLNVRSDGSGSFAFQLAPNTPPVFVGINIPKFLQYFADGPFTASNVKNGLLEVEVPKPGNLEVAFDLGQTPPAKLPFTAVQYQVVYQSANHKYRSEILGETVPVASIAKPLQLSDVPPGTYMVSLVSIAAGVGNNFASETADPRRFRDHQQVALRSGQTEKVAIQYVPLDANAFRGTRTAVVRIDTCEGKPAAGRDATVSYYVEHYGMLPVFSGKVPETGELTLSDLADAKQPMIGSPNPFSVRIGADRVGGFAFRTSDTTEYFEFRCPPQVGDMAPDVELLNVADGKTIKLSELRGKLVLLDFWATWCGPCQPALEKIDKLAAEKASVWNDRVAVVPVSVDNDAEQAKNHLISRGWTHLNPYWTGAEGKLSFEAPAMQAFVINSIPTSFLIDPAGYILWRGHPLIADGGKTLEDRIEAALAGKTVSDESPALKSANAEAPADKAVRTIQEAKADLLK